MRLTLRSLLAFLDDVLPPESRQLLADKVAGSAVAKTLMDRMRRVVALPEISAPRPDARGLGDDANSVAEFLDNCLAPERLADMERICLESDMHLAEVAACHGMLAETLHDPTLAEPLDDAGRERLLKAIRQRTAALAAESERSEARANAEVVKAAIRNDEVDTLLVPASRRAAAGAPVAAPTKSPWLAWASAAVALLLLLTVGGVLVWSVAGRGRRVAVRQSAADQNVAHEEERSAAVVAEPASAEPVDEPGEEGVDAPGERPVEAAADAQPQADEGAPASPAEPEQPAIDAVAAATATAADPAAAAPLPTVPQGNALAIAAVPTPAVPSAVGLAAPAADDAVQQPVGFVDGSGLLLHRGRGVEADQREWMPLAPGAGLDAEEDLLAPPGFHPYLSIGGVTIRLLPATRIGLSQDADGVPRVELVFGRIVARASRADARLGITAGGMHGIVTAGLTAPVAVSVDLERAAGADPASQQSRVRAEIIPTSGGIAWRQVPQPDPAGSAGRLLEGIAPEGMLEARTALVWDSRKPGAVAVVSQPAIPEWVATPPRGDAVEARAAASVEEKVRSTAPLTKALRELAADRRAENRSAAVAVLALLGEYDELVEVLCADAPGRRLEAKQWSALEATTVPLALARGANSAAKLRQAFVDHGPQGKADLLEVLIRGVTDDDLAAGADRMLIEALDDPELVVRRYAAMRLYDIVQPSAADRLRYRPDGLPEMRRDGVAWWRSQLEKGLVRRAAAP